MGPSYAGILASLAFVIVILRGALHGYAAEGTIKLGILMLCVFAVIGYVIGRIAGDTVRDSIRDRVNRELEALEQTDAAAPTSES